MSEFKRALWAYVYPSHDDLHQLVNLAKGLHCDCIIAKCGNGATFYDYWSSRHPPWKDVAYAVKANGLKLGAEIYAYGYKPEEEGAVLARALHEGADFAVVNAEVEWEHHGQGGFFLAQRLADAFYDDAIDIPEPGPKLYLCSDTRGSRWTMPYMEGFRNQGIAGYMRMVYPQAFYPNRHRGYIQQTFDACFQGKFQTALPEYPVIQAYDGMDYQDMLGQIVLAWRWGCEGVGIYVSHDINGNAYWGIRDAPTRGQYIGAAGPKTYTKEQIVERVKGAF